MSDEYKGFVKLHRKIVESKIFDDAFTYKVFSYCMIKAKFKKNSDNDIGTFDTTYEEMAKVLKMTKKTVIKHVKKLEDLGALKATSTFYKTTISVINFENYNNTVKEIDEEEERRKRDEEFWKREEEIGEIDLRDIFKWP